MTIYIYLITNQINGKVYIGQTNNIARRWSEHCCSKKSIISKAIRKYGKDNFMMDILHICTPSDDPDLLETKFIASYKSVEEGYNISATGGSNRGVIRNEEWKSNLSKSLKGREISPEARQKQSKKMKGRKIHSEEHKEILREKMKGESNPMKLQENKDKISKSKLGESNPMFGRTGELCPASKLSDAQRDEIRTLYASGEATQTELATTYNVTQTTIWRILQK